MDEKNVFIKLTDDQLKQVMGGKGWGASRRSTRRHSRSDRRSSRSHRRTTRRHTTRRHTTRRHSRGHGW